MTEVKKYTAKEVREFGKTLKCDKCQRMVKEYMLLGKEGSRVNCMEGCGPTSKIMLIGEAPGANEAVQGKPFVGKAGNYLRKQFLNEAGISMSSVRIENAVKCRPVKVGEKSVKNRKPTPAEVSNCRTYMVEAIKARKPRVIIALGGVAWGSLTGLGYITKWQGYPVWSKEFNCWIMPVLHPSAIMRDRNDYDIFRTIEFCEKAVELSKKLPPSVIPPRISMIHDTHEFKKLVSGLIDLDVLALDLETSNPKRTKVGRFYSDRILGVSFCGSPKRGYYVPYSVIEKNKELFSDLLENDAEKVMHNSSYDVKFLWENGYKVNGFIFDTLLAHHLLDENFEGQHGLKPLSWRYTEYGGYDNELKIHLKKTGLYQDIPDDVMAPYSGMDSVATLILRAKFKKRLKEEKLWKLFVDVVMPSRTVLNAMEFQGIALNLDYLGKLSEKMTGDLSYLVKLVRKKAAGYGVKDLNLNSSKQLQYLFFRKMRLKPVKRTKTGYSTDAEVLEELGKENKIAFMLSEYRKLEKLHGTYVEGMYERLEEGRIYGNYNTHGTVTGRLSSVNPNLQNIPRDRDMRRIFIASKGMKFLPADFSQAELRAVAHYSQDPFMIKAYEDGRDIHSMVAMEFFGTSNPDDISVDQRSFIKTINFGVIYGRGAMALSQAMGITFEEAQDYLIRYFERFPKVKELIEATVAQARQRGYVETMFGRKRRLPELNHDDVGIRRGAERQAVNTLIQGTIADMTNIALVRIDEGFIDAGLEAYPVLQVHDEIVSEVKKSQVAKAKAIVREAMERPFKGFTVPMVADISVSDVWGEEKDSRGVVWKDYRKEFGRV